jgi:hypothetical protein
MDSIGGRSKETQHLLKFFTFAHLPPGRLQEVSQQSALLAHTMKDMLDDGDELTAGLRKLLEAKDCFVRAAL